MFRKFISFCLIFQCNEIKVLPTSKRLLVNIENGKCRSEFAIKNQSRVGICLIDPKYEVYQMTSHTTSVKEKTLAFRTGNTCSSGNFLVQSRNFIFVCFSTGLFDNNCPNNENFKTTFFHNPESYRLSKNYEKMSKIM